MPLSVRVRLRTPDINGGVAHLLAEAPVGAGRREKLTERSFEVVSPVAE
jgi:hypothetical protein